MKTEYLIVGAGLSGLYMAHLLEKAGKDYRLIEARDRIGGRVLSSPVLNTSKTLSPLDTFDMGPSWFWPQIHPRMSKLIKKLQLSIFSQHSQGEYLIENQQNSPAVRYKSGYEQSPKSMRVAGGMQSITDALLVTLEQDHVQLNTRVQNVARINEGHSQVTVSHNDKEEIIEATSVIFAMPLRLLADSISFQPSLPTKTKQHFSATATWMAAHAKFFAIYDSPFWRKEGLSGDANSRVGPLVEIHDASTFDGVGALFGFVGIDAITRKNAGDALIKEAAVAQLTRIFGDKASQPIDVKLIDWCQDPFTSTSADQNAPAAHPHYGLRGTTKSLNKLNWYFSGTEAAQDNGGYLEGALEASEAVLAQLNS